MTQKKLTCAVMRGGTSKGVYLLREQLPTDPAALKRVLLAVMGSPDARQIDGLGGGEMLTSKVAMVAKSAAADADIDYHFAQVVPGKSEVDTSPTCGNILSGVGAFAIEFGLFPAADGETELVVRDVNTGAFVEQVVQTPGGRVEYAGDCVISGAPGSAAPVALNYLRFAGVKTGRLFPAGAGVVEVDGIETTCIDAAMPVVFAAAESFGLSGRESAAELQADRNFFARMESVRLAASEKMGLGDARGKVIPKFALVASPEGGGGGGSGKNGKGGGGGDGNGGAEADIISRYFTPVSAHAAYAVSGGIALSSALATAGTLPHRLGRPAGADSEARRKFRISHPSGLMEIDLHMAEEDGAWVPQKAGVIRTARLLMTGEARVPAGAWG